MRTIKQTEKQKHTHKKMVCRWTIISKTRYRVRQEEFGTATYVLYPRWNSSGGFAPAIYAAAFHFFLPK